MDSVLEYVNLNQQSTAHTRTAVYLFCDSVSAIEAVYKRDSCLSSKCINRLNALCPLLAASGLRIFLLHIAAHSGLQGNIIADKYAKDTAFRVFKGEITAPINVSTATAFTVAGEISVKSWQRLWDHKQSGRYTYNLTPVVKSKLLLPVQCDIGISKLLHDSNLMLKDDNHRSCTWFSNVSLWLRKGNF